MACSGGGEGTYLRPGPLPEARGRKLSGISGALWREKGSLPHWWREVGWETGRSVPLELGAVFQRSTTAPFSSTEPGAAARGAPSGSLTPPQGAATQASPGPPARGLAAGFSTLGHSKTCPCCPAHCLPSLSHRDPGPERLPWTWD